ncbi:MAG: hypothetical protein ABSF44_09370 [Candidatus Bathyarchaeia archaeon]|jgi:hypothetical protein
MKIKERVKIEVVSLQGWFDAKNNEARINEALRELQKDDEYDVISIILKRTCAIILCRSKHLDTEQLEKKR